MTPNELYAMAPVGRTRSTKMLAAFHYTHIPEAGCAPLLREHDPLVEIRILGHRAVGPIRRRKMWRLATVWFEEQPVMIIQNGGRKGFHSKRFITDVRLFERLVAHLTAPYVAPADVFKLGEDAAGIDEFSGFTLAQVRSGKQTKQKDAPRCLPKPTA